MERQAQSLFLKLSTFFWPVEVNANEVNCAMGKLTVKKGQASERCEVVSEDGIAANHAQ